MSKPTLCQILCAGLHREGHRLLPKYAQRSSRYITYAHHTTPARFFYVGPAGALRIGRSVTDSNSCNDKTRTYYLTLGNQALVEQAKALAEEKAKGKKVATSLKDLGL